MIQTHHGAREAWEQTKIAQDPRKHRVPGRMLRVVITRIISEAKSTVIDAWTWRKEAVMV